MDGMEWIWNGIFGRGGQLQSATPGHDTGNRDLLLANDVMCMAGAGPLALPGGWAGLQRLETAHAGADAHRHHAVLRLRRACCTMVVGADRAGRAERMAQRDCAAERLDWTSVQFEIPHRQ